MKSAFLLVMGYGVFFASHEVAELVAEAIGLYDLLTKLEAGEADASCDEKIREIAKSLTRRLAA